MDIAMNFTLGLSQGIAWPWPIAVYPVSYTHLTLPTT